MAFETVAVLGPGLLGGSLGLARQARALGETRFWGRSAQKLAAVRASGFFASTQLAEVVAGADLVVLATPVDFYQDLAKQLVAIGGDFVVTDVGSVKGAVQAGAGAAFAQAGMAFVGSHPMAGSEQGGFEAARADLFQGAACLVCPAEGGAALAGKLAEFWELLGCAVSQLSVERHDEVVARISHLPHALAAVGAHVALRSGEGHLGGGGLIDTTRVAGGNAAMWNGIFGSNKEALLRELARAQEELARLEQLLRQDDSAGLTAWLERAKTLRDEI